MLVLLAMSTLALIGCGGSASTSTVPSSVHNEWTWMGGADIIDQVGVYGAQSLSSSSNGPGARVSPVSWTDASGNFWLFGGYGAGATLSRTVFEGDLNDLWEYSNGKWSWVSGSNQTEQAGIYGKLGIPAPGNVPGGRYEAVSWTDTSGNFWLFGGLGVDSTGTRGYLNDLWKYSSGQWTWMSGSNLVADDLPGVYGTKGVASPENVPSALVDANAWSDAAGNLWLFGGGGRDSNGTLGNLNALWKYSAGEWTWMSGANLVNQLGTYGTLGIAAPGNVPGARDSAVSWTDSSGNLWLFGGMGNSSIGISCGAGSCFLNDLWKYREGEWTWMGGTNLYDQPGTYGTQGTAAPGNIPGARWSAARWTDSAGNFWLFGGQGCDSTGVCFPDLNDLWKYSEGQWTWVSGSNLVTQAGNYGTLGVAASSNYPGCRDSAVGWADTSGNVWIFGGTDTVSFGGGSGGGSFNDLWEYQP